MKIPRFLLGLVLGCVSAVTAFAAEGNTFNIFEYQVEGSSILPVGVVEKAVYPFLGENRSYSDVESARMALEKAYHDAGYLTVLVSVPEQKVNDATVRLSVVEAPVSRLRVTDSRYFSLGEIKATVPALQEGQVPQFAELQEQMVDVNRSQDRRVTPVLRPGRESGTVEADLKVEDQFPLHASLEANNRISDGTSPTRAAASLRWDNLWDKMHSLGLSVQGAPERPGDSQVVSLNYNAPLAGGNNLSVYAVHSESDVAVVGGIDTIGRGDIVGLRYLMPLPGSASFYQSVNAGLDYKDFKQSVSLVGGGGFNTPIHYMPATLGWDGSWNEKGHEARLGVSFNFHWPGMVGTEQEFADKRFKGQPGYAYLRGNFSRKDAIYSDWTLEARGSWQYSTQALISNEQYSIGGADSVRGYYESMATGENGIGLTLELATPNLVHDKESSIRDVRLVAFVDSAQVSVVDPLFATSSYSLTGSGVGLRMAGPRGLSLTLDLAWAGDSSGTVKTGDNRLHFRLAYDW